MLDARVKFMCRAFAVAMAIIAGAAVGVGAATVSDVTSIVQSATLLPSTRPVSSIVVIHPWMPRGFHVIRDIAYVANAGRSRCLDIYLPNVTGAPRPLMVWIHGGGWFSGDKATPPGMGLLLRGFNVASINYRLSSEAIFPAQIFDCKAAIRFLRAHAAEYGIDPTRIGVWGDSAGGQLASLLGTTNGRAEYEGIEGVLGVSSKVEAVCDWFGPSDFLQTSDIHGPSAIAVRQLFGGMLTTRLETAAFASPAEQVGRAPLPPFLIMHGDQDPLVPVHQSQVLYDRLRLAGDSVRFMVVSHSGHGNGWFKNSRDISAVYDFFDRTLGKTIVGKIQARQTAATTRPAA
jgi:acetyl esterase/lipase